eukprot:TRINITY_DN104874_c0_g1_i1.p1 TRINITY_DN104874_c0_g1~~TRINITY_DN104874_c0_g1_i1.p1  ORF type:complete len:464 (+),score=152.86 TRINITY_DN104874_c0_g1_i1:28-1392(+)
MPKAKGKKKPARHGAKGKTEEVEEVVPSNKIFVGNLSGLDITDEKLKKLFESCGDIRSANLVSTANHAFGFVEFATVDEAERAIAELNGESGILVKFARSTSSSVSFKTFEQAREDGEEKAEEEQEEEADLAPLVGREASCENNDHEGCNALLDLATARAAATRAYPSPIESLDSLVQKATRATSTKDYIAYSFEEEDFGYVASVELLLSNGSRSCHSGESRDSKKDAKKSAALVALRDPEVHRLLPPLPGKLREHDAAKPASLSAVGELPVADAEPLSQGEDVAESSEEVEEKAGTVSAKELRKQEKNELRAKRLARRKAAKAFKAALAEVEDEESSDLAETDSAEDHGEDDEQEEEGEEETATDDDDDDEDARLDPAELAAKKAAIKAALASKRRSAKGSRQAAVNDDVKKKLASDSKKKSAHVSEADFKMSEKVKDTKMQANFGQTKFIKP